MLKALTEAEVRPLHIVTSDFVSGEEVLLSQGSI